MATQEAAHGAARHAGETLGQDGVFIVGQYIDGRDGREWTGRDGVTRQPYEVTVLMGRSAVRIEYRTPADAAAALVGCQKGDTVALRVFTRAAKDRVFYSGMSARQDGEG